MKKIFFDDYMIVISSLYHLDFINMKYDMKEYYSKVELYHRYLEDNFFHSCASI